jgi:hypothetical protein
MREENSNSFQNANRWEFRKKREIRDLSFTRNTFGHVFPNAGSQKEKQHEKQHHQDRAVNGDVTRGRYNFGPGGYLPCAALLSASVRAEVGS